MAEGGGAGTGPEAEGTAAAVVVEAEAALEDATSTGAMNSCGTVSYAQRDRTSKKKNLCIGSYLVLCEYSPYFVRRQSSGSAMAESSGGGMAAVRTVSILPNACGCLCYYLCLWLACSYDCTWTCM
jgi:hypothetical protein